MKMKIKFIKTTALLCLMLVAASVMTACAEKITDAEARETLAGLLPRAQEITRIVWGEGLETEDPDVLPLGSVSSAQYYPVSSSAPYRSVDELKSAAQQVFSEDYLRDIYAVAFGEYEAETTAAGKKADQDEAATTATPESLGLTPRGGRYAMRDGVLCRDITYIGFEITTEIDPATARVVKRGYGVVICEADCVSAGEPSVIRITLCLENGVWHIDSPVY